MPTFGLDSDEIRRLASSDAPHAFVELAIACVAILPSERPKIRTILEQLMVIERGVIDSQASSGYNVGSLTRAARHTGPQSRSSRLKMPHFGRVSSFDGQINAPSHSEDNKDEDSSSDEDVEETLTRLERLRIGGKGSIYLNAHSNDGTSQLLETSAETRSSAYAVVKGSRFVGRSSLFFTPPAGASSVLTIKPDPIKPSVSESSLPSLPASWLEAVLPGHIKASPVELEIAQAIGGPASVPSKLITSVTNPLDPATPTSDSLRETRFATIKSLSIPIPAMSGWMDDFLSATSGGPSPHRFTLIKPGWKALWETPSPPEGKVSKRLSRTSEGAKEDRTANNQSEPALRRSFDGEKRSGGGGMAISPLQLLYSSLSTRCHACEKRFGLMKPYLSCDDCQKV